MVKGTKPPAASNDDIGPETRLELYRLQVEIRDCEKRAYDLFLQNLIKGTSHLSLGQEAIAAGFGVAALIMLRRLPRATGSQSMTVVSK